MLKYFLVLSTLVATLVQAVPSYAKFKYSAPLGLPTSAPGIGYNDGFLDSPVNSAPAVVPVAILTNHQIQYYSVPTTGYIQPATVEVGANSVPVNILFRSASSQINVQQMHEGSPGTNQETSSEDEPHRLIHSVLKPIIQEVHEVIVPMRRITQEITPVQEQVQTLVARGQSAGSAPVTPVLAAPAPVALSGIDGLSISGQSELTGGEALLVSAPLKGLILGNKYNSASVLPKGKY